MIPTISRQPSKKKPWLIVGFAFVLLLAAAKYAFDVHTLAECRVFIEDRYATQIALIEQRCVEYTDLGNLNGDDAKAALAHQEKVREELADVLKAKEVFDASWSRDGHHGLQGLLYPPTGYHWHAVCSASSPDGRHSAMFGRTFDGQPLVVYEGWVRGSGKRHYKIVFYSNELNALRAAN